MDTVRIRSHLIAGTAGIAALLMALFALKLSFWIAGPAAIVVYLAVRLLMPSREEVAPGIAKAYLQQTLQDGAARITRIRRLAGSIGKRSVQTRVLHIASIAEDIYADLKQEPKDINQVPDFAKTYLDPLINVLDRYTRVSRHNPAAGTRDTLRTIEVELLPRVEKALSGMYEQLVRDHIVDLDAAGEGLRSLLDLESTQ